MERIAQNLGGLLMKESMFKDCPRCGETGYHIALLQIILAEKKNGEKVVGYQAHCPDCLLTAPWGEYVEDAVSEWNDLCGIIKRATEDF